MSTPLSPHVRAAFRAVIAITLLAAWLLAAATGWLLWLAPEGPRSGQVVLLFGLAKHQWGEIHFGLSVLASAITVVHVVVDWRALRGCVRHLTDESNGDSAGRLAQHSRVYLAGQHLWTGSLMAASSTASFCRADYSRPSGVPRRAQPRTRADRGGLGSRSVSDARLRSMSRRKRTGWPRLGARAGRGRFFPMADRAAHGA
jgi:hypothetical protein